MPRYSSLPQPSISRNEQCSACARCVSKASRRGIHYPRQARSYMGCPMWCITERKPSLHLVPRVVWCLIRHKCEDAVSGLVETERRDWAAARGRVREKSLRKRKSATASRPAPGPESRVRPRRAGFAFAAVGVACWCLLVFVNRSIHRPTKTPAPGDRGLARARARRRRWATLHGPRHRPHCQPRLRVRNLSSWAV